MTLGYPFQTRLFWIVSRGNNCTYCMGHQEAKLSAVGMTDDQIAALDGDWSAYSDKDQAAFAFTKKLTLEPQNVGEADIESLRRFYNDDQILEILLVVGNFNAMNRWTGALKIPQEEHRVYLTPTSPKYQDLISLVAPLAREQSKLGSQTRLSPAPPAKRPELESRSEVEEAWKLCRNRKARLPLADEATVRASLPSNWPSAPLPNWVLLLGNFSKSGPSRAAALQAAQETGNLSPLLKAEIAWVAARNDRAWYALGRARQRLHELGQSDDEIFALDDPATIQESANRAALLFARKLTVDPAKISDADVSNLRSLYSDMQVAELIHVITNAAFFDRFTEPAGLPLEN
jgi:alkylhydroperoxidase family enzyme